MASTTRSTAAQRRGLLAGAILLALAATASAHQAPQNLGYGLDKLVARSAGRGETADTALREGFTTNATDSYAERAIKDEATGRVLVDITLDGRVALDAVKADLAARIDSLQVTAVDRGYRRTGIIEGYVAVDQVAGIAATKGVRAVFLALKPDIDSVHVEDGAQDPARRSCPAKRSTRSAPPSTRASCSTGSTASTSSTTRARRSTTTATA